MKSPIIQGDDIVSQQYHTYTPYSTSFNSNDEVRITIQSQDLYVLPSESYLHIEFSVSKKNNVAIVAKEATFTYWFIAHLFSEMRYELNGFEIDRCKKPGITSLLKNLTACKPADKAEYELCGQYGYKEISATTCEMILPLRFFFGFCEDFNKIVLNSKHELILVRSRSNANMYQAAVDNLQFDVKKIHWKVPHISLSDKAKLTMLKTISRNEDLFLTYRTWDLYELPVVPQTTRNMWSVKTTSQVNKPRFVIVSFQTNRSQVIAQDASQFDHCNISNIKLYLNNERFPYDDLNLNFDEAKYHELHHKYLKIQESYYNGTESTNPNFMDYNNFFLRVLFPFDCTRTDESVKPGMVDVRIEFEARQNIPANTTAYCLIIHDNLVRYSPFTSIVHREI